MADRFFTAAPSADRGHSLAPAIGMGGCPAQPPGFRCVDAAGGGGLTCPIGHAMVRREYPPLRSRLAERVAPALGLRTSVDALRHRGRGSDVA